MKVKQLLIGGDSPPAVIALGEDGSVYILEAKISDVGRRAFEAGAVFGISPHMEYSWRQLPDLPGGGS